MLYDFDEALSIEDYVKEHNLTKLWLCPDIVTGGKIERPLIYQGYECVSYTVPDELKDKKVKKHFVEEGVDCLIWFNR